MKGENYMLMNSGVRHGSLLTEVTPTAPGIGTTITANATINTKGATPTQLIASTANDSYGIQIHVHNNASSNATTATLLDIMSGGAGSETVLIPDLMAGWIHPVASTNAWRTYTFPLFIPAGTRLSARSQSVVASKTCSVAITLMQRPTQLGFVGTRVTAYGVDSANSRGQLHTAGATSTYGTATQLTASTTNPIRYMQMGIDPGNRTTVVDAYGWARIQLGTSVIIDDLLLATDTGTESIGYESVNQTLATRMWDIPAATQLQFAVASTAVSFSSIIYGVD
jgi:hypothetical protein